MFLFDLIIGNIRTTQMLAYCTYDQLQQPVTVRLGKQSFGHIEQRTQCRDSGRIAFTLIVRHGLSHGLKKFVTFLKGFQEQAIHALPQRANGGLYSAKSGHNQYGDVGLDHLRPGDHVKAIDFGHANVDHKQVKSFLLKPFDRNARVCL